MDSCSDCESGIINSSSSSTSSFDSPSRKPIFDEGLLVEVPKDESSYELIRAKFLAGVDQKSNVVMAVHRRNWCKDAIGEARVQTFKVYAKILTKIRGGGFSNNIKFGWFGGSKERIQHILKYGFSYQDLQINNNNNNNNNGVIFMSHVDYPTQSVNDSSVDENGLRHVLLCRVLLGRSELFHSGSGQLHPSSENFDSAMDSNDNPKNYVVWSSNMNTHILPEYVVTFKVKAANQSSSKGGVCRMKKAKRMPTSPWISFPKLISVLGEYLGSHDISLIIKYHMDYRNDILPPGVAEFFATSETFSERIILRSDLIRKVRQIAGDKLLITIIKSFKCNRDYRMSFDLLHTGSTANNCKGYHII